jgi:hypothetical protein
VKLPKDISWQVCLQEEEVVVGDPTHIYVPSLVVRVEIEDISYGSTIVPHEDPNTDQGIMWDCAISMTLSLA